MSNFCSLWQRVPNECKQLETFWFAYKLGKIYHNDFYFAIKSGIFQEKAHPKFRFFFKFQNFGKWRNISVLQKVYKTQRRISFQCCWHGPFERRFNKKGSPRFGSSLWERHEFLNRIIGQNIGSKSGKEDFCGLKTDLDVLDWSLWSLLALQRNWWSSCEHYYPKKSRVSSGSFQFHILSAYWKFSTS